MASLTFDLIERREPAEYPHAGKVSVARPVLSTRAGWPHRMRLADLIGQDTARTALLRAIERGHLAHAYLFDGPPGVGKRGAALGLAMALNCADGAGRGLRRVRDLPAHRRRPAPRRPDVRPVGPRRSDRHRRRAHDPGAGAHAAARGHGARHRRRGRRRDEPERRQLPAEDAGGTAGAQSPGPVHQRARSAAADHPLAHAARSLPPAVGRRAAGGWRAASPSPKRAPEIAATLADGSAARLFALAAADDDGAAAEHAGGAAGGGRRARDRARVRLRRRADERQGRQGGQGRPRQAPRS